MPSLSAYAIVGGVAALVTFALLGAGAFGTALGLYCRSLGHHTRIWAYDEGLPEQVAADGENAAYLPGFPVPRDVLFTGDMAEALAGAELVLLVVPLMGLSLGALGLAAERERGTLDYLLAQPVSRAEIFLGKYVGLAAAMLATTDEALRDRLIAYRTAQTERVLSDTDPKGHE